MFMSQFPVTVTSPYMAKNILQGWLRWFSSRKIRLDYPGELNVIARVLIRVRSRGELGSEKELWWWRGGGERERERWRCYAAVFEDGGKEVSMNQVDQTASRSSKRQGDNRSSPTASRKTSCRHLDCGLVKPVSDFWPPKL